ncbi:MAG: hypothetical protein CMH83_18860 [Nocardioides sp.]|nr:hypothetical protein [Nocardioides sp.]
MSGDRHDPGEQGFYNASAPPPDSATPDGDPLEDLQTAAVERDLMEAIAEVERVSAELDEHLAAGGDPLDQVDAEDVALAEEISSAEDAPLPLQSLRRRVVDGTVTYREVLAYPEEHTGAVMLMAAVLRRRLADLPRLMERPPGS